VYITDYVGSSIGLTRDIDIAILSVRPYERPSVCLSVRYVLVFYGNSLTYCHDFFTTR